MNHFIKILDSDIYYEMYGEGTPMLIIHGWGVDHRIMSGCMEPVFENNEYKIKRIYIDLPGMGQSKASKLIRRSDDILDVLIAFIDQVIPQQSFILAGESYGGYISRAIIQKRRAQIIGLMLLCPLIYPGYRQGDIPTHTVLERDDTFLESLSEIEKSYFQYMSIVQNREVWERFKRDIFEALLNQDSYYLNNVLDGAFSYDIDTLEEKYQKPSLIIVGRQDTEVGYKDQFKLLDNYPRASFVILDKAGHNLQIEQNKIFGNLICEWLDRVMAEI